MQGLEVGNHFAWTAIRTSETGEGVVTSLRSDRQEGLSPETEDYAARWAESTGLSGARAGQQFTLLLATDGMIYLDGEQVKLTQDAQ